jgi:phage shock protein A
MTERNLAKELGLLATEVDSLAKSVAQAKAEAGREADRRKKADATAEQLREELRQAKRRARVSERELGRLSSGIEASTHAAVIQQHELELRLKDLQQANEQLRQEVDMKERQCRTLEANLREVLENLRNAAREAEVSKVVARPVPDEATLVEPGRDIGGW